MRQETIFTSVSIKDKLMFSRYVCRTISFFAILLQIRCTDLSAPQEHDEPNRVFVDTLIRDNSGEVVRREIGMMKNSQKDGCWISFYPDGGIRGIEFFKDDKWNGPWYSFHENGLPSAFRGTKYGVFQGKGYNYYENGTLMSRFNFVDDHLNGYAEEYDENDDLIHIWEYSDGEYVRTISGNPPLVEE